VLKRMCIRKRLARARRDYFAAVRRRRRDPASYRRAKARVTELEQQWIASFR
jgi:hypothetical protein